VRIGGAHGFDFAGLRVEFLQRPKAQQLFVVPQGIAADLRRLKSGPIEREHMAGWRVGVHAFEMSRQQRLHAVVVKVEGLDESHWRTAAVLHASVVREG